MPPSASDWTRFKKLSNSFVNQSNLVVYRDKDIRNVRSPGACVTGCQSRAGIRRDQDPIVGSGRTRREASVWTDFVASQQLDFVTVVTAVPNQQSQETFGRKLICTKVCVDGNFCPPPFTLPTKVGVLKSAIYQRSRIV